MLQLPYLRRRFVKPAIPKNSEGKALVHIGCGTTNSPAFINIDARPLAHVHIATNDITSLADFETGTGETAHMYHIPERIKGDDLRQVLSEVSR